MRLGHLAWVLWINFLLWLLVGFVLGLDRFRTLLADPSSYGLGLVIAALAMAIGNRSEE